MAHEIKNKLQSAALHVVDKITGKERKKNIIFYFTDQQRYDTANNVVMPNLYALSLPTVTAVSLSAVLQEPVFRRVFILRSRGASKTEFHFLKVLLLLRSFLIMRVMTQLI